MPGEDREGGERTLRTGLEAVVAATTGGPCRRRWWARSAGRRCEASAPEASGFARRPALDDGAREPAVTARRGRGAGDGTPGRDGRSGRRRLGTDMASGGGERIGGGHERGLHE
jgi:hypothetical protein